MSLTLVQQTTLAVMPKITASLSVICSLIISFIILKDARRKEKVFHRLVLGISLTDAITSFWWIMSTWPIPRESGALWAIGNTRTCTCQGFFLQVGIANPLYNFSLSAYYLLTVHWSWGETKLRKVEYLFHLIPLGWGITTALIGLPFKIFNNASLWCWIADFPGRNEYTAPFRWGVFYAPLWLSAFLVTLNLAKLVTYFKKITMISEKYLMSNSSENLDEHVIKSIQNKESDDLDLDTGSTCDIDLLFDITLYSHLADTKAVDDKKMKISDEIVDTDQVDSSTSNSANIDCEIMDRQESERGRDFDTNNTRNISFTPNNPDSPRARNLRSRMISSHLASRFASRRRRLAWQCLRYAVVFYITWFPITLLRILQAFGKPVKFPLLLAAAILTPLQGMPNFLVYLYPLCLLHAEKVKSKGATNRCFGCCRILEVLRLASRSMDTSDTQPRQRPPRIDSETLLASPEEDRIKLTPIPECMEELEEEKGSSQSRRSSVSSAVLRIANAGTQAVSSLWASRSGFESSEMEETSASRWGLCPYDGTEAQQKSIEESPPQPLRGQSESSATSELVEDGNRGTCDAPPSPPVQCQSAQESNEHDGSNDHNSHFSLSTFPKGVQNSDFTPQARKPFDSIAVAAEHECKCTTNVPKNKVENEVRFETVTEAEQEDKSTTNHPTKSEFEVPKNSKCVQHDKRNAACDNFQSEQDDYGHDDDDDNDHHQDNSSHGESKTGTVRS